MGRSSLILCNYSKIGITLSRHAVVSLRSTVSGKLWFIRGVLAGKCGEKGYDREEAPFISSFCFYKHRK
jgi:hypothetical protein